MTASESRSTPSMCGQVKPEDCRAAHAIGHKKIDVFPSVTASRVRLNILSSTDAAAIREFQLYNVEQGGEAK